MITLGIDVGTSALRAAVSRDGAVTPVRLSEVDDDLPSAVLVATDGMVLVGEAAVRRRLIYPEQYVEDLARYVRDEAPVVVDGTAHDAAELLGALLRHVVAQVVVGVGDQPGGTPEAVCLAHPAHWSSEQVSRFDRAVRAAGLPGSVSLCAGTAAAAEQALHDHDLPVGSVLAVHDLGAGPLDVAVLERTAGGLVPLAAAAGGQALGGNAMDAVLATRVVQRGGIEHVPALPNARTELERACGHAREALQFERWVTVADHGVDLNRGDVEVVAGPVVDACAEALLRVLGAAGVPPGRAVLISVGGCAAMPAVSRGLRRRTGLAPLPNPHGTLATAMGAARLAEAELVGLTSSSPVGAAPSPGTPARGTAVPVIGAAVPTPRVPGSRRRGRRLATGAAVLVVAGLTVAAGAMLRARPAAAELVGSLGPTAPGLSIPTDSGPPASDPAESGSAESVASPSDVATGPGLITATPSGVGPSPTGVATGRCPTVQDAQRWGCLTQARAVGRTLSIGYTLNFVPVDKDEPGYYHLHFYTANPDTGQGAFVTSPRDSSMQAVAAPRWGTWYNVYASGLTVLDARAEPGGLKKPLDPSGFSLLCVRVADGGHELAKDRKGGLFTGNCVPITR